MQRLAAGPAHYTYLDMLRGFAAFSVLIVHYRWFYAITPGDWGSSLQHTLPLSSAFGPLYDRGGLAVQLFWILSGVIFTIKYGNGGTLDAKKFWIWRFARLYPLHFCTLILIAALQFASVALTGAETVYTNNDPYHFALQVFLASNWGFEQGASFNAPIWSISVEIIAYAVFCIYVICFRKYPAAKVLILFASSGAYIHSDNVALMCISLFFLGSVIAEIDRFCKNGRYIKYDRLLIAGTGVAVITVAVATMMLGLRIPDKVFYYFLFPCTLLLVLDLDHRAPPVPKQLEWFGAITYSTYLMHMPILIAFKLWIDGQPNPAAILASPIMLVIYLGTVIGISIIVYRHIEIPAQKAIQRWYFAKSEAAGHAARKAA